MSASRPRVRGLAHPAVDYWESGRAWWDVALDSHTTALAIEAQARARTQELIRFALSRSRLYRRLYGVWHARSTPTLRDLPHVSKTQLESAFDDWVTDPAVTRARVEHFLADPGRVGQAFLDHYAVWTSSGTSGQPGIFVHDPRALAVYDALEAVRFRHFESPLAVAWSYFNQERYALVGATGAHFVGNATVARIRLMNPALASRVRMFSIMDPIGRLTTALNEYQPTLLATYPSSALLLAQETERGALRIGLQELWTGGESLCDGDRSVIRQAFHCLVRNDYGCSEFPSIAFECDAGLMHVNADWVILEPVDKRFRPVPAGERSHSVLLTNLANFVQPIIRYDLGDSVTMLAEPCRCGSPFPALRVEGRRDDALVLAAEDGSSVTLLPLALETVLEEQGHLPQFQLIQTGPASLRLRADIPLEREAAWHQAEDALRHYMGAQGLRRIEIVRDPHPPAPDPLSGKRHKVIAPRAHAAAGHAEVSIS